MSVIPNWCSHSMLVEGSPEDIAFFKQTMNVSDKHGEVKVLSEEPLISYPEEFKELDRTYEQRKKQWDEEAKANSFDTMSEEARTTYLKKHPYVQDGYNSGGYEWEKEHYGTKWGFADPEIVGETENSISYVFQSAWSPPSGLFKIMGEKFPNLKFTIDYEEEGMGFAGTYEIQGDDLSNAPREIGEICPECDEPVDMCECPRCPECRKLLDAEDSDYECDCEARKKKKKETEEWQERWHRRSSINLKPNVDYTMLIGLKKKADDNYQWFVDYKGKKYFIEYYEEGGHGFHQLVVDEINPKTRETINEIYTLTDPDEIHQLIEDGFLRWDNLEVFLEHLDQTGQLKAQPKRKSETELWQERWHKRSNIKCAIREEQWDVYNYDVWGNEDDGFDVNDVFRWGSVILPENPTLAQVIENLKRVGFLSDEATVESIREDGDDDVIYLDDASNNYPLCQLRRTGVVSDTEQEQKIKEWQERWHRRGKSIMEEKVVEANGLML